MPELPEVESIRRFLEERLKGGKCLLFAVIEGASAISGSSKTKVRLRDI